MKLRNLVISLPILAAVMFISLTAEAGVETSVETFENFFQMNGDSTTAWWDTTGAGQLTLPPFQLVSVDTSHVPGHSVGVMVSGDYAFVAAGDSGLQVVDVTHPDNLVLVGGCDTPGNAYAVAVAGNYAYVADGTAGLRVMDISDPENPTDVASEYPPFDARGIAIAGNYAYIADGILGMFVINVADPLNPAVGPSYGCGATNAVAVEGNSAYLGCSSGGFHVVDISNPMSPTQIATSPIWIGTAYGIAVAGNYAFVANGWDGLFVVDIDVDSPQFTWPVGGCLTNGDARGVTLAGDWAYVGDSSGGLTVVDISDPVNAVVAGPALATPGQAVSTAVSGEHAYVACVGGGLVAVDIAEPMSPPLLVAQHATLGKPTSVTTDGNYAYVTDGDLVVFDIENPWDPEPVDTLVTPGDTWDVKIAGDIAYVADGEPHLLAVDITDPRDCVWEGFWGTPEEPGDIVVSGDYAYVADGGRGLVILDVSVPAAPDSVYRFHFGGGGIAKGLAIRGDYCYVADNTLGLRVVDISNPLLPVLESTTDTPGTALAVAVDSTGTRALVADGDEGVQVLDVTDVSDPSFLWGYQTPGKAWDVEISGNVAVVADGDPGVLLIDFSDPLLGTRDTDGDAWNVVLDGDYAYVADATAGFHVIDVSDPQAPGSPIILAGTVSDIAVEGSYAYASCLDGLWSVDVTDPTIPDSAGYVPLSGIALAVDVSGVHAYVAAGEFGVQVVDVTDPENMSLMDSLDTYGNAQDIVVEGNIACVAGGTFGLQLIDVSNPDSLVLRGTYDTPGLARGVAVSGDYAYVADGTSGLLVIDVSNPGSPKWKGQYNTPGSAMGVDIVGDVAFVADSASVVALDVSTPATPVLLGSRGTLGTARGIAAVDSIAFVADGDSGLQVVVNRDPVLATFDPNSAHPDYHGTSYCVKVVGDSVFLADGPSGVHLIDITDPASPQHRVRYRHCGVLGARRLDVVGDMIYIATQDYGLTVYDQHTETPYPVCVSIIRVATPGSAVSVAVRDGYAYVMDDGFGLWAVNLEDAECPTLVNAYNLDGYARTVAVDGDRAYTPWAGGWAKSGFHALDIHDPLSIAEAGATDYSGHGIKDLAVDGDYVYAASQREFRVFNISDPADPIPWGVATGQLGTRGLAISGDHVYTTDTWFGLRVFDVRNPASPTMVGAYDPDWEPWAIELSGDYGFVADHSAGLHVVDISNPLEPTFVTDYPTSQPYDVTVDGDYAYIADHDEGLIVLRVFDRESKPDSNVALSTAMDTTNLDIGRCQISTVPTDIDSIRWELSADGGGHWQEARPGSLGCVFSYPGTDLLWKANLYDVGQGSPVCNTLTLEWWFQCPLITDLEDVPDDMGKWMRVEFIRSGYDFPNTTLPIVNYFLWRRIDESESKARIESEGTLLSPAEKGDISTQLAQIASSHSVYTLGERVFAVSDAKGEFPEGTWEYVLSVPALQRETYTALVPTIIDSNFTMMGDSLEVFCVSAHRETPTLWYVSPPDSGYSIDDVGMQMLRGLCLVGPNVIEWLPAEEEDLDCYTVYVARDTVDLMAAAKVVDQTEDPSFELPATTAGLYVFVTACDRSGHESPPSRAILNATGVTGPIPSHYFLAQNVPNPFNPITEITYGIPAGHAPSRVEMSVYDPLGRKVRTLVDADHGPGTYSAVWDGRDHNGVTVASGIYFYRLTWNGNTETKRMVLLK